MLPFRQSRAKMEGIIRKRFWTATMAHKQIIVISFLAVSLLLAAGAARAEDFSGKLIKLLVGASPGGTTDTMARAIATPLSTTLGRPVIPEHRSRSAVSASAGLSPNLPRPLRGAKWGQASWLYNDHLALTLRGIHSMFGRQGRRF